MSIINKSACFLQNIGRSGDFCKNRHFGLGFVEISAIFTKDRHIDTMRTEIGTILTIDLQIDTILAKDLRDFCDS